MKFITHILVLLTFIWVAHSPPPLAILDIKRVIPFSSSLKDLHLRDQARYRRTMITGVVNFDVEGSSDLDKAGFFFTKLKIGYPPREYSLLIDTASEISWVSCIGCNGCRTSNVFGKQVQFYNPDNSSSSSMVPCSDDHCYKCTSGVCNYVISFVDNNWTKGFLVRDIFHLNTVMNGSATHFSTSIMFGCSKTQSGLLAVDGLLGFNPGSLSLISQLGSPVFSHCLSREENGGGKLLLGNILEPGIVYTPLDLSQLKYNVNLQNIAVNGKIVQVDSVVFDSKNGGGTIVDSGTSLTILAQKAYEPVISSLTAAVSQYAKLLTVGPYQCFTLSNRMDDIFPLISFNFEGGKSMTIKPKDYLIQENDSNGAEVRCIGFQRIPNQTTTILGDIVLREKIVTDYNCSKPIKVSSSGSSSPLLSVLTTILTLFMCIFIFFMVL